MTRSFDKEARNHDAGAAQHAAEPAFATPYAVSAGNHLYSTDEVAPDRSSKDVRVGPGQGRSR